MIQNITAALTGNANFHEMIQYGAVRDMSVVHKFGFRNDIDTTLAPLSTTGMYQTPSTLTSLEILSASADDTSDGTGARKICVEGLSTDWGIVEEIITLNGTTPVALVNQFFRVFRMYVHESGVYGTQTVSSHAGAITLRVAGAGATWSRIDVLNGFGLGQTQVGAYTVPKGFRCWVNTKMITVESNKTVDFFMFKRENCDVVTAPYTGAIRVTEQHRGAVGQINLNPTTGLGPFNGPCDIGFMASVTAGVAAASVDFEIILQKI